MRSFFAFLLAGCLLAAFIWLCSLFPAPMATSSVSQHISLDNHVTLTVVNNMPFDWSGVALTVISIAVLLYVIGIVVQAFMELRRRKHDRITHL